jgi:hypothetical protein
MRTGRPAHHRAEHVIEYAGGSHGWEDYGKILEETPAVQPVIAAEAPRRARELLRTAVSVVTVHAVPGG